MATPSNGYENRVWNPWLREEEGENTHGEGEGVHGEVIMAVSSEKVYMKIAHYRQLSPRLCSREAGKFINTKSTCFSQHGTRCPTIKKAMVQLLLKEPKKNKPQLNLTKQKQEVKNTSDGAQWREGIGKCQTDNGTSCSG